MKLVVIRHNADSVDNYTSYLHSCKHYSDIILLLMGHKYRDIRGLSSQVLQCILLFLNILFFVEKALIIYFGSVGLVRLNMFTHKKVTYILQYV